jgi:hypothetical protein
VWNQPATPAGIDRIEVFSGVFSSQNQTADTIAHEVGHGTNLPHHGTGDRHVRIRWNADGSIDEFSSAGVTTRVDQVIDAFGNPWSAKSEEVEFILGSWRGQSSGEERCLMRYQANVTSEDGNGEVIRKVYSDQTPRGVFCESDQGTSFNVGVMHPPSRFGPAILGFDKGRIAIRDQ